MRGKKPTRPGRVLVSSHPRCPRVICSRGVETFSDTWDIGSVVDCATKLKQGEVVLRESTQWALIEVVLVEAYGK